VLDAELKATDCDALSWRRTVVVLSVLVVGCRCDVVLCGLTVVDFTRSACFVANTQHINKYISVSIAGKNTHTHTTDFHHLENLHTEKLPVRQCLQKKNFVVD